MASFYKHTHCHKRTPRYNISGLSASRRQWRKSTRSPHQGWFKQRVDTPAPSSWANFVVCRTLPHALRVFAKVARGGSQIDVHDRRQLKPYVLRYK